MAKEAKKPNELSIDPASIKMLEKAKADGIETAFERAERIKACPIGADGSCCKHCAMGPCRVPLPKKDETPEEKKMRVGVCGATPETIAARNFLRMIAAGAAAHSDHGRGVAETFLGVAKGEFTDYKIKDEEKLLAIAPDYGVDTEGKDIKEIALEVGKAAVAMFGNQQGELALLKRAPAKRLELWRKLGVVPRGIDREVVEIMHRTHMGVDQDYENLLKQGAKSALGDGWGGSMIATDLQDVMFGTPKALKSEANLGILKEGQVNIIVHGHEPLLSEMIVAAASLPEMLDYAKSKGAEGINLGGICCTANEILMRHGIPLAGDFLQQELAIITGAVDAMVVDVQCIMQALANLSNCFHTKLITTNVRGKMQGEGVLHIEFHEDHALETAKKIVTEACDNFVNRRAEVMIPDEKATLIAGFSVEEIKYQLGGFFRKSFRPLNDAIISGRIRGLAGVVGCNNARTKHNEGHVNMVKELIKNNVLVVTTGCNAMACAKAGLMTAEAAHIYAGAGLAEVCETVGLPPVVHLGSCVDNSRILMALTEVVLEGGLGEDISDIPVAGAAPEWMSEKAISIGQYVVSSGVYTMFCNNFPTMGSPEVCKHLFEEMGELYGATWDFEKDPVKAAHKMIAHIDKKREALGINVKKERVLMDMADRQKLEA